MSKSIARLLLPGLLGILSAAPSWADSTQNAPDLHPTAYAPASVQAPAPGPTGAEEKSKAEDGAEQANNDFKKVMEGTLPLTPDQIATMLKRMSDSQKASRAAPPSAMTISIPVSLSPGEAPPLVRVAPGYATALTVADSTGAPWPITSATVGDSNQFSVSQPGAPGNVLTIAPRVAYAQSNLIIMLKDSSVPLVLQLASGDNKISYYRASLLVQEAGPNAIIEPVIHPDTVDNGTMRTIMDGLIPQGARAVKITGGGRSTSGVMAGGKFYLRTPLTILSPAWSAVQHGGGISVYEMPITPLVSASGTEGEAISLKVDDAALIEAAFSSKTPVEKSYPVMSAVDPADSSAAH